MFNQFSSDDSLLTIPQHKKRIADLKLVLANGQTKKGKILLMDDYEIINLRIERLQAVLKDIEEGYLC